MINLSTKQKRKVLRAARNNPLIILNAINETIELGSNKNRHGMPCQINISRLKNLALKYKKKLLGDDEIINLFIASKFPNPIKPGSKSYIELVKFLN